MLPRGEHRQRIRHKLHTPVYASFSGPNQGIVLDLSELLDLHEDGFCVQTSEPLEPNRAVNVCLDLPETKTYVQASGRVVWSDATGRAGIRFSGLAEQPRRSLQEWLFVNLLIAAANHNARSQQLPYVGEDVVIPVEEEPAHQQSPEVPAATSLADLSGLLFAVDAVRRELRVLQGDFDGQLKLLTQRAMSLTGAAGAALALHTDGEMLCRAIAGEPTPPLNSVVDVKHGFSGECVRSGRTAVCEDAETDGRVDAEVCRSLGICSIMAAPIFSDFRVAGLLEVFSPRPRAFVKIHEIVLERLAEVVPQLKPRPPQQPPPTTTGSEKGQNANVPLEQPSGFEMRIYEPSDPVRTQRIRLGVLFSTASLCALILGYELAPTIERHWLAKPETAVQAASPDASTGAQRQTGPITIEAVRELAEQGNPEAQWDLGSRYHQGDGVPQDDALAVHWFQRAAEQGNVTAQGTLGAYYWAGRGVPPDLSKAYFWSVLAMAQGDENSKSRVEGLASRMTRAQIAAARQQADEWIRQHARN